MKSGVWIGLLVLACGGGSERTAQTAAGQASAPTPSVATDSAATAAAGATSGVEGSAKGRVDGSVDGARVSPKPGAVAAWAEAVVAAGDRTEEDRARDARRHPAELLTFIDLRPGMRVADLGAGDGYTTELLARVVGSGGSVLGQNNRHTLENFVKDKWPARLQRSVMKPVRRLDLEYDAALPAEVTDLDGVTLLFSYHDVIAQGHDTATLNAAVFRALKPGGYYVIADHTAKSGSGRESAKDFHRIDEGIVRQEVTAAGFELVDEAQFLRDPEDLLGKPSFRIGFETDRFLLKFKKPGMLPEAT